MSERVSVKEFNSSDEYMRHVGEQFESAKAKVKHPCAFILIANTGEAVVGAIAGSPGHVAPLLAELYEYMPKRIGPVGVAKLALAWSLGVAVGAALLML